MDWLTLVLVWVIVLPVLWMLRRSQQDAKKVNRVLDETFAVLDQQLEAPCGVMISGAASLGLLVAHRDGLHKEPVPQLCWRCKANLPITGTDWPELTRLGHTLTEHSKN